MAGYSGTPLAKKLGIMEASRVAFVHAPATFAEDLGDLPAGVDVLRDPAAPMDLIILFCERLADLTHSFAPLASRLAPSGVIWVGWTKKSSGVVTDLDENRVRDHGLESGLVDVKVCAINGTWSGLKFVYRLKDRPARP